MGYLQDTTSLNYRRVVRALSSGALTMALVALAACSSVPRELSVRTVPTEIVRPTETPRLPNPRPVQQRDVPWRVLTPSTLPDGSDWVFMAITPRAYEDLAHNQAELLRFIQEAMWRLRYYRGELPAGSIPPDEGQ